MNINLKKILCPVDFSITSSQALNYALAFAEKFDAEILLIHVVEIPTYTSLDFPVAGELIQQFNDIGTKQLETCLNDAKKKYAKIKSTLTVGNVFYEVIQCAKDNDIDLIIVGSHGRTGLAHVLMGSEAEKIVRKAPCPVLTVKNPEHEFVMP